MIHARYITWLIVLVTIGCGTGKDGSTDGSRSQASTRYVTSGVTTSYQYLDQLGTGLNYDIKSNGTIQTAFANLKASMPQFADVTVSSPISRSFTDVAYRACSSSFNDVERFSTRPRVVFRFIDTGLAPSQQGDARLRAFFKHLTYRMWGESGTDAEITILVNFWKSMAPLVGETTNGTAELIPYSCAVVASSLPAYLRID